LLCVILMDKLKQIEAHRSGWLPLQSIAFCNLPYPAKGMGSLQRPFSLATSLSDCLDSKSIDFQLVLFVLIQNLFHKSSCCSYLSNFWPLVMHESWALTCMRRSICWIVNEIRLGSVNEANEVFLL